MCLSVSQDRPTQYLLSLLPHTCNQGSCGHIVCMASRVSTAQIVTHQLFRPSLHDEHGDLYGALPTESYQSQLSTGLSLPSEILNILLVSDPMGLSSATIVGSLKALIVCSRGECCTIIRDYLLQALMCENSRFRPVWKPGTLRGHPC